MTLYPDLLLYGTTSFPLSAFVKHCFATLTVNGIFPIIVFIPNYRRLTDHLTIKVGLQSLFPVNFLYASMWSTLNRTSSLKWADAMWQVIPGQKQKSKHWRCV